MIFAIPACKNMIIYEMNIDTAFLNAVLVKPSPWPLLTVLQSVPTNVYCSGKANMGSNIS